MTIVVKKVPKCLRGIVKLLFGIKEKWHKKSKNIKIVIKMQKRLLIGYHKVAYIVFLYI